MFLRPAVGSTSRFFVNAMVDFSCRNQKFEKRQSKFADNAGVATGWEYGPLSDDLR